MKIYTIGYGGRAPKEFHERLTARGIKAVVDVRLRPDRSSMGVFAKTKDPAKGIQGLLATAGIEYHSLIELGNVFMERADWAKRYRQLLDLAGSLLTDGLKQMPEPLCLLCAEKRVAECHRGLIAEFVRATGSEVEHIE